MRFYRVCVIDGTDRIEDIQLVEAADDQEALRGARDTMKPETFLEVWDQRRLVGRLSPVVPDLGPLPFVAAEETALAT